MNAARPQTLAEILEDAAQEIDAAAGVRVVVDTLGDVWTPLDAQPGRGMRQADGRVLSPQALAFESLADETFFGGAGGGGKTDLGLGLAFTSHRSSIVFRREFTQLRGAEGAFERAKQIVESLGDRARINESTYTIRVPGRTLEFGAAKTMGDLLKWKGRPHDLKVFDELPEFMEAQYRFLTGWLRTTHIGQRTRVVGTGNPPMTSDGQWVIRYWGPWLDRSHPRPARAGELRWFVTTKDGKDLEVDGPDKVLVGDRYVRPRSRTFIPAMVEDNPYYMQTGYADVLDSLPEPLRSQMRHGDFTASTQDDQWQVVPTAWVEAAQARWRPGAAPCGLSCLGCDPSRGGAAEFAMAPRHGHWIGPLVIHQGVEAKTGVEGAQLVWRAIGGDSAVPVQIDVIGSAGSSVFDHAVGLKLRAISMNGSERSEAHDRSGKLGFVNKRAEWHWRVREMLDPDGGQDIALPPDPQLKADLTAPRWRPTPRGVQVELKENVIARIGRSPDRGEAVIYALADEHTVIEEPRMPVVLW